MTRCLLILFLLFAGMCRSIAQPAASIINPLLQTLPMNAASVARLNAYAEQIQFSNPIAAIESLETAIQMAKDVKDNLGLSIAYGQRASLFFYEMKLDSCQLLLDKAYNLVKGNNNPACRKQLANLIGRYAAMDQRRQNFDRAVERHLQAASIFNEIGEPLKIISTYYNLAGIYKFLGDTARMFYYARETNRLAEQSQDSVSIVRGLIALSDAYCEVKKYDTVLLLSQQGLRMASSQQLDFAKGIFNKFLGICHSNYLQQYNAALYHFNQAIKYFAPLNIQYDIALVYQHMGNTFLQQKKYDTAVQYSGMARQLGEQLNLDQVRYYSLKDLVEAERAQGNLEQSYQYLQQFVAVSDSIQLKNNRKKVYELESRYQAQQKEIQLLAQQKVIERQTLLNYLLAAAMLCMVLMAALLYRNYRHKQKLQVQRIADLETEKKLLATQAVLKGEEQERTRLAQDLHDGLGGLLSGIKYAFGTMKDQLPMTQETAMNFERSMDMLDTSIVEMRRIAHNMMPEALVKFGLNTALKDFCNQVAQSGALQLSYQSIGLEDALIDRTTSITVYRIVQELLNNIMKHAAATTAIVQVSLLNKALAITVEDDGKGFRSSSPGGMGFTNMRNRVDFLKGSMDVRTSPGTGTSVHIELQLP